MSASAYLVGGLCGLAAAVPTGRGVEGLLGYAGALGATLVGVLVLEKFILGPARTENQKTAEIERERALAHERANASLAAVAANLNSTLGAQTAEHSKTRHDFQDVRMEYLTLIAALVEMMPQTPTRDRLVLQLEAAIRKPKN